MTQEPQALVERAVNAVRRKSGLVVPDHAVELKTEKRSEVKPGEVQVIQPKKRKVETGSEAELDLHKLLDKLEGWLLNQPEWVRIMTSGDRQSRRRTAEAMAKYFTTIPAREGQVGNRKMRRNIIRAMRGGEA